MTIAMQAIDPNQVQDEMDKHGDSFYPRMGKVMQRAMADLHLTNAACEQSLLQKVADFFNEEFASSPIPMSINNVISESVEENVKNLVKQSFDKQLKAAVNAEVAKSLAALVDELVSKKIAGIKEEIKKKQ